MKLALKDLSRKLLSYFHDFAKMPLLNLENNPQVVFYSELNTLPEPTAESSYILSFTMPSSTAAQICVGNQSFLALSENESIVFNASTRLLADACFNKAVKKQHHNTRLAQ